jgi:uncharacterized membrane protein YfcA
LNIGDITAGGWAILGVSALLIGMAKTGLPGVGILAIPLVAWVIPARESTGLLLPMLIVGDIFAVSYYHRHAVWKHLGRLLPFAIMGIVAGYWGMQHIPDRYFGPIIGGTILVMLILNYWQDSRGDDVQVPKGWWFPVIMGLIGGVTTMMANAAGPILVIYLLAMQLPKTGFIGTGAWFFLIINCLKVPFSANLGLINPGSLTFNLILLPVIILGALTGIRLTKRIPEKAFRILVQIFAVAAAIKLLF